MVTRDTIENAKLATDTREIVALDLGVARRRSSDYWVYRCPFHDDSSASFTVYSDHYFCYGCGEHGDSIRWLQRYRNLTFVQAVQALGITDLDRTTIRQDYQPPPNYKEPPSDEWQSKALEVCDLSYNLLWSDSGLRAREWLNARGLSDDTIHKASIGYVYGTPDSWHDMRGLKVPAGILLPWLSNNMVWGIKVRRAAGKPKYVQVGGGKISAGLYNADNIRPGKPLLLTEGEFDCLLVQQVAGDLVNVATLGSATTKMSLHWLPVLATCTPIFACYDNDEAGSKGGGTLASLSTRIVNVRVPIGKDPTDLEMSEPGALREWILSLLPAEQPQLNPVEFIDQLRAAAGDFYSNVADPVQYFRDMRGEDETPAGDPPSKPTLINLAGWNADYRCPQHPDQWYYLRRTADGWMCALCAGVR